MGWIVAIMASVIAMVLWLAADFVSTRLVHISPPDSSIAFAYSRRVVYGISLLWALGVFVYSAYTYPTVEISMRFMVRIFGLTAMTLVMTALIPGLIQTYIPRLWINSVLIQSRRAIGVSAFLFAAAHASGAFVYNLSASIVAVLSSGAQHKLALSLSATAFLILAAMAATSFDRAVAWLGMKRWKWLHRTIYIAALTIVFHALLIGSHYVNRSSFISLVTVLGVLVLLILEAGAITKRNQLKQSASGGGRSVEALAWVLVFAGLVMAMLAI